MIEIVSPVGEFAPGFVGDVYGEFGWKPFGMIVLLPVRRMNLEEDILILVLFDIFSGSGSLLAIIG